MEDSGYKIQGRNFPSSPYCNEFKLSTGFLEGVTDEDSSHRTFNISTKESRFSDPYTEFTYSSKPKKERPSVKDLINLKSDELNNKSSSTETLKVRYDDTNYTKVYRNPLLNKREKYYSKVAAVKSKLKPTLNSTYQMEYNKTETETQGNMSNSGKEQLKSIETDHDKKLKYFYTSSYNNSYDDYKKSEPSIKKLTNPEEINLRNNQKFRPLAGNLLENINRGKYSTHKIERNCNSWRSNMDSVIYPFKN